MDILKIKTPKRKLGSFGEKIARRYLRRHGYRIKAKNFVADDHEIDLIAEDKSTLVFVEVKTRTVGHESPNEPRPASSVDAKKQRGLIMAARAYTASFSWVFRRLICTIFAPRRCGRWAIPSDPPIFCWPLLF